MKNQIKIKEFTFQTLNKEGDEIYGALIDADGWPVKGTSGWYRTEDIKEAAALAVLSYEYRLRAASKGGAM